MTELRDKRGMTEAEAIAAFQAANYPRPSLTADIAVFARQGARLRLLMIKRGGHPSLGCWALPGGFAEAGETIEQTAARELQEETGVSGLPLVLVGIYSAPGRDPRGWTVSAAYAALLDEGMIDVTAGDDAAQARWVEVVDGRALLPGGGQPAFDHAQIIMDAYKMLQRR